MEETKNNIEVVLKDGEKLRVTSIFTDTCEDIYASGCVATSYSGAVEPPKHFFDSLDSLLARVKRDTNSDLEFTRDDTDCGRFNASVLVDEDNETASELDLSRWKEARKRLWVYDVTVYVSIVSERKLCKEDFKNND